MAERGYQALLRRILADFDGPDGRAARQILQDRLLEAGEPWGTWMLEGARRSSPTRKTVERTVYARLHRVLTKKGRRWSTGFLTTARLRTRHLEDLEAAWDDPLWSAIESLTLAPNQGERIPHVVRWFASRSWPRLHHLGVDDPRFVAPLVRAGLPESLRSIYLWSTGDSTPAEVADALPDGLTRLHVQVFQLQDAEAVRPLFERHYSWVRVDLAQPWMRDLLGDRVATVELHSATFSLVGRRRSGGGYAWTVRRRFEGVEHHLWRFVERWPRGERDAICPRPPPTRDADWERLDR